MAPESQYDTKASPLLNATAALDPEERSPWLANDGDGRVIGIGSGVIDANIFNLLYCRQDSYQDGTMARTAAKGNRQARRDAKGKRRRLHHTYLRKYQKVRNLVDNVHRHVIAWLTVVSTGNFNRNRCLDQD